MNDITELVNILSNTDESLTKGLFKLKVLAASIQNNALLEWISKELRGYNMEDELPEYRKSKAIPRATFTDGHNYRTEVIPVAGLDKRIVDMITNINVTDDISAVEEKSKMGNEQCKLLMNGDMVSLVLNGLKRYNPTLRYATITDAHVVPVVDVNKKIISVVRDTALNMVLGLQGFTIDVEEIIKNKDKSNKIIYNIMSQNNIVNHGDANSNIIGDGNSITQNITIQKGDFEQLRQRLLDANIEVEDINDLEHIIQDDNTDVKNKKMGDKTNGWIKRMIDKYFHAGEQVGYGAIGSLLANAIGAYFGFPPVM